jgi:hypothetical protein
MIQTMPTVVLAEDGPGLCLNRNGVHVCERARGHKDRHALLTKTAIISWIHSHGPVLITVRFAVGS